MKVKLKEQFYHPTLGLLPRKRANKSDPFQYPASRMAELPSDAVIVEGTDEEKAELQRILREREAARVEAKNAASVVEQKKQMDAFIRAMQSMQQMTAAITNPPVPNPDEPYGRGEVIEDAPTPTPRRGRRRPVQEDTDA